MSHRDPSVLLKELAAHINGRDERIADQERQIMKLREASDTPTTTLNLLEQAQALIRLERDYASCTECGCSTDDGYHDVSCKYWLAQDMALNPEHYKAIAEKLDRSATRAHNEMVFAGPGEELQMVTIERHDTPTPTPVLIIGEETGGVDHPTTVLNKVSCSKCERALTMFEPVWFDCVAGTQTCVDCVNEGQAATCHECSQEFLGEETSYMTCGNRVCRKCYVEKYR